MAETLGYDVTEVASGRVVVTAKPSDAHLNPAGTVHGGLAATMLDSCMGLAIRVLLGEVTGVDAALRQIAIGETRRTLAWTRNISRSGVAISAGDSHAVAT
jgi:acyl-coenzyme A thioesterase PaaI-like protein